MDFNFGGYVIEGEPVIEGEAPTILQFNTLHQDVMDLDTELVSINEQVSNAIVNNTETLDIASSTTTTLNVGLSNSIETINIGTSGQNSKVINVGSSSDTINLIGATVYNNVTNLDIKDKLIALNVGGSVETGFDSGFEIEENNTTTGYVKTSGDRNYLDIKVPGRGGKVRIHPHNNNDFIISEGSHEPVSLLNGEQNLVLNGQVLSSNSQPVFSNLNVIDTAQISQLNVNQVLNVNGEEVPNGIIESNKNFLICAADTDLDYAYINSRRENNNAGNITSGSSSLLLNQNGGSVGIGKVPQHALDVQGDVNVTGSYKVNGNNFITSQWTTVDDGGVSKIYYNVGGTGLGVGIGVPLPKWYVDVNGPIFSKPIIQQYWISDQSIADNSLQNVGSMNLDTVLSNSPSVNPYPILFNSTTNKFTNNNQPSGRTDTLFITVNVNISWNSSSGSSFRYLTIVREGSVTNRLNSITTVPVSNEFTRQFLSSTFKLGNNESFYIAVYQNSGGSLNIQNGNGNNQVGAESRLTILYH